MNKKLVLTLLFAVSILSINAQRLLTIEQCRDMALKDNKEAQMNQELVAAATDLRKAALASFFPKISANGAYMWNEKNLIVLPDQVTTGLGSFVGSTGAFTFTDKSVFIDIMKDLFPDKIKQLEGTIGSEYKNIRDNYGTLDIHNIFVGQVGITQPIYVGGRLREAYNLSKGAEKIAKINEEKGTGDILVNVNEAYWRVVSVQEKLKLATQYADLLHQLEANVEAAIEEGVATKADLLKVKVKVNDAEMMKAKAEDGLALSKMALCQICGLSLDEDIILDSSELEAFALIDENEKADVNATSKRAEVQILTEGEKMARSVARLASASLQPNILASANYIISNPSCFNGFENKFGGAFNVGVVVNIPIAHADAIYRYKSAKHTANVAKLKLEETIEKIELQITQSTQKVKESNKKLKRAQSNMENAEETMKMAKEAYEEGVATATDLMMAETGWQQAYSERIDAAVELRMNELTLQKHLGQLDTKQN